MPHFTRSRRTRVGLAVLPAAIAVALSAFGCATLQQVAALRRVEFELDRVSDVYLAGVRVDDKRSYADLRPADVARLAAALATRETPLTMIVHVRGTNPAGNNVAARLVRLDWTLLLEEQETVSGSLGREYVFEPGAPVDVPVSVELDLLEFFSGRAQDLFDLALAAAGMGPPTNVALRAQPTVETPIGPIRYPAPITISRQVGSR